MVLRVCMSVCMSVNIAVSDCCCLWLLPSVCVAVVCVCCCL